MLEELRNGHTVTVDGLKAEHAAALASLEQTVQKQLSNQSLELKATSEDLTKAKAALTASLQELELLKSQLAAAQQDVASAAASAPADQSAEVDRLQKELTNLRDDHNGLMEVFNATKESMQEMSRSHHKELESLAEARAEEVMKLRSAHETEVQTLVKDKSALVEQLSDLEGELTTAKASIGVQPLSSPKRNGNAHSSGQAVSKEDLQRMHEAHTLKLNDVQAEHEKALKTLREELEVARAKSSELSSDVERKELEIGYLEQDQEEKDDQITRYVRLFGLRRFINSVTAFL